MYIIYINYIDTWGCVTSLIASDMLTGGSILVQEAIF